MGGDMDFDFDMIIAKGGHSDVETPWHQDESYWLDLPDKRAISFWIPMQDVTVGKFLMNSISSQQRALGCVKRTKLHIKTIW